MKSAGKARNNGLYRHIRTSKEIIRNLLNDSFNILCSPLLKFQLCMKVIFWRNSFAISEIEGIHWSLLDVAYIRYQNDGNTKILLYEIHLY